MQTKNEIVQGVKMLLVSSAGMLWSAYPYARVNVEHMWFDNKLEASCGHGYTKVKAVLPWFHRKHIAPEEKCSCGIYATSNLKQLVLYDNTMNTRLTTNTGWAKTVLVRLTLWGKIIPYEKGYRSQYAEVVGLYKPICTWHAMRGSIREAIKVTMRESFFYCEECLYAIRQPSRLDSVDHTRLEALAAKSKLPILSPEGG